MSNIGTTRAAIMEEKKKRESMRREQPNVNEASRRAAVTEDRAGRSMMIKQGGQSMGRAVRRAAPDGGTQKIASQASRHDLSTRRGVLARIYEIGQEDSAEGERLYKEYERLSADPSTPLYDVYSQPTGKYTKTNYTNTLNAQAEWGELQKELGYWAARDDLNLSDDEIIEKAMGSGRYKTLQKMDDGRANGYPLGLTEPVGYSEDAMYGVLWASRNPDEATGDPMTDAVQGALGRGKAYAPDKEITARRTAGSGQYAPYTVASTMEEETRLFGVKSFDGKWLEDNYAAVMNSGDSSLKAAYAKIYEAEQFTAQAEEELRELNEYLDGQLKSDPTQDADRLIDKALYDMDGKPYYTALDKLDEGIKSGKLKATTRAIAYDRRAIENDIRTRAAQAKAQAEAGQNSAALNEAVEAEKAAQLAKNGSLMQTDTMPESLTAPENWATDDLNILGRVVQWLGNGMAKLLYGYDGTERKNGNQEENTPGGVQAADAPGREAGGAGTGVEIEQTENDKAEQETAKKALDGPEKGTQNAKGSSAQLPSLFDDPTLTVEYIPAQIEEGDYEGAAENTLAALNQLTEANPELASTDMGEKTAMLALLLANEAGVLDDPAAVEKAKAYEEAAALAMDLDPEAGNAIGEFIDDAFGGAISQTGDNKGMGLWETVKYTLTMGGAKFNQVLASAAGALVTGYGHAVEGTNWVLNNTAGKAFGFEIDNSLAEATQQAGQDVARTFEPALGRYEAYLRENASTLEYFVATSGSEAIKMMGMGKLAGALGRAAGSAGGAGRIVGSGLDRSLTTAQAAVKLESASKMATASPFAVESGTSEFNERYMESDGNFLNALLCGTTAAFATLATSELGVVKNIEASGLAFLPDVTDAVMATPGNGALGAWRRWGKAGLMYVGNLLKSGLNEATQEVVENVLTTAATDPMKGKRFADRLNAEYAGELTRDAIMGFMGSVSSSLQVMPTYARSVKVAEANMRKSKLSPADVGMQLEAFIADAGDPQVMENAAARASKQAVETETGLLIAQGALGQEEGPAAKAAGEAETRLAEARGQAERNGKALAAAQERVNRNPADPKAKKELLKAIDQQGEALRALESAETENARLSQEARAERDGAMERVRQQARENVAQRIREIRKFDYSEVNTEANIQKVAQMNSVVALNEDEFTMSNPNLKSDIASYYNELGGMVRNPVLGDVALDRKGIKSSIAHGLGPQKVAAFAAVPTVLEQGEVIDLQRNWKNRGYDTFVIAAPITIHENDSSTEYYCGVVVKRTADAQRYYVHEVFLQESTEKELMTSFKPGVRPKSSVAPGDAKAPSLNSLLKMVRDVKSKNMESTISLRPEKMNAVTPAGTESVFENADASVLQRTAQPNVERPDPRIQRAEVASRTVRTNSETGINARRAVKSPADSAKELARTLGIGADIGSRKVPRGVLGYYDTQAKYLAVRAREAGNLSTTMHELGHAIGARLGMTGTDEMVASLDPVFGENYSQGELAQEAFAEFMWRYMTDGAAAERFAGNAFVDEFENNLRKQGLLKAVRQTRDEMHAYVNATVNERIGAVLKNRSERPRKSLKELQKWFTGAMIDNTRAMEDINDTVRTQTGRNDVAMGENLRSSALLRNTASRRAYNMLTGSLTDSNWQIIGDGLATRFERAGVKGKDFDLLNNYMLALHSLDRDAAGKPVFDASLTTEQREAFIRDVQQTHPEVARAEQEFQQFRNEFMKAFLVDTGYMTQETLDRFNEMYPHYVPTFRVKDGKKGGNGTGGKAFAIRRAKGSTENIYNPMDSFVQMVDSVVNMVSANNTALVWDELYHKYEGLGLFGREVTQDLTADTVDTTGVQRKVREIMEGSGAGADVMEGVLAAIGESQTQWKGTGDVALPNVLTVQRADGTRAYYELFDAELYKAFLNNKQAANGICRLAGYITRTMSALTTGSNPVFAVRNFMRDFQKSVSYGSWASNYATGAAKWLRSAWEVFRESGEYADYKALGGGGWNRIEAGTKKGADAYRGDLFKGYNTSNLGRTAKWAGKKIWNTLTFARLNEVVEQASRYAEYRFGAQDRSTAEGKQQAFLNAQEATVDFSRSGYSGLASDMKQVIPFLGASMQGIYQTGREYTTKAERGRLPARFAKTVLNTALASALANALILRGADDEDKEEFGWLSDELKADNLFLPNCLPGVLGDAPYLRIPLGQDPLMRAVHGAVTNAIWSGEGGGAVLELSAVADNILDGFNPINGTIFDAALAASTNRNWYGSAIVPTRMEGWHPTTQYTEETADLFVTLSRGLDAASDGRISLSPMMLEYMTQQYTGFLGQMAIPAISKDKNTGEMAGLKATLAGVRKRLTSDPLVSNGITSSFYEGVARLTEIANAAKNGRPQNTLKRNLADGELRAAVDEAKALISSGGALYEVKKALTDGYAEIDQINARTDLSDHEKYVLTSQKRHEMMEEALAGQEVIGEYRRKYMDGERAAERFLEGGKARFSTTFEKLPESYRADYEAGKPYMQMAYDAWQTSGKDSALPHAAYIFSDKKVKYEVEEARRGEFEAVYKEAYQRYVESELRKADWEKLGSEEKVELMQKAHSNAQAEAKGWYLKMVR